MFRENFTDSQNMQVSSDDELLPSIKPEEFLPNLDRWTIISSTLVASALGLVFILAATIKYNFAVTAAASIRPVGETKFVEASRDGTVKEISVRPNQTVEKGDIIVILDDLPLQIRQKQLNSKIESIRQQLARIKGQITALDEEITARSITLQRIVAVAEAELSLNQQNYNREQITTEAEVKEANATVALAREELTRFKKLANTGAVSSLKIKEKESALQAALARQEIAQAGLEPSNAKIVIAKEQIKKEIAKGKAIVAALNREKELLIQKQAEMQNQLDYSEKEIQQILTELEKTIIRAPVSGIIQHLNLRNSKQVVSVSQVIAQIAMKDAPPILKASVGSSNIQKINVGQSVNLKISACPYPDYGILQGIVTHISPDTISNQQSQRSYEIDIQPESLFLKNSQNKQCTIKPGMDATANFITKQETIISFILRKARLLTNL